MNPNFKPHPIQAEFMAKWPKERVHCALDPRPGVKTDPIIYSLSVPMGPGHSWVLKRFKDGKA